MNYQHVDVVDIPANKTGYIVSTIFDPAMVSTDGPKFKIAIQDREVHKDLDCGIIVNAIVLNYAGEVVDSITDVVSHHIICETPPDKIGFLAGLAWECVLLSATDSLIDHLRADAEKFGLDFESYVGQNRDPEYKDVTKGMAALTQMMLVAALGTALGTEVGSFFS